MCGACVGRVTFVLRRRRFSVWNRRSAVCHRDPVDVVRGWNNTPSCAVHHELTESGLVSELQHRGAVGTHCRSIVDLPKRATF